MPERPDPAERRPLVERVLVRNYKSIERCDVALGPLTVLVGRNGAGKSNFLDALRFVADGLRTSLDHAIKARGGIDSVRRRSTGHPRNFAIQLRLVLPGGSPATYGFEVAAREKGGFIVKSEGLKLPNAFFHIDRSERGSPRHPSPQGELDVPATTREPRFTASREHMPPPMPDRLYLVTASGFSEFRPVYDALLALGFYSFNPKAMRDPQTPDAGELLHQDGSNIASVIARLERDEPEAMHRVTEYLAKIVPSVQRVQQVTHGAWETIEFHQEIKGARAPWRFEALSMSDGTLRAVGALVAIMQRFERKSPVQLAGIEEPETALHPAAVAALSGALHEAALRTQVIVTCHSPDVLDHIDPEHDGLFVVQAEEGVTTVARVDPASREMMKDHLRTPGELLRLDLLAQDPDDLKQQAQFDLFKDEA